MTKKDLEIATYFAEKGKEFCIDLKNKDSYYFKKSNSSYFAVALALSLCWTKHAKYDDIYVEYASKFIDAEIPKDNDIIENYHHRFGPDGLEKALLNYRKFYNRVKHLMPDFSTCSIHDINKLQTHLLNLLDKYRSEKKIAYIGPWLFLGPFKIILGNQERLWSQNGINAITLPTGMEVDRGIKKLKKKEYSFMDDFNLSWLEDKTSSLLTNYATSNMVHAHLIKIADMADVPALYINNALYLYGKGDI